MGVSASDSKFTGLFKIESTYLLSPPFMSCFYIFHRTPSAVRISAFGPEFTGLFEEETTNILSQLLPSLLNSVCFGTSSISFTLAWSPTEGCAPWSRDEQCGMSLFVVLFMVVYTEAGCTVYSFTMGRHYVPARH